jgi:hypothetical protein
MEIVPGFGDKKDVKVWDLINPNKPRSEQEEAQRRLDICMSCEHLNKRMVKCNKCGCFMKLKTTLQGAKCPIGKW